MKPERKPLFRTVAAPSQTGYVGRVVIAVAIVVLAWLALELRAVIVVVFGGVLAAVALRAASTPVQRLTGLRERPALALVLATIVGILALGSWLIGEPVTREFGALRRELPGAIERVTDWLDSQSFGPALRDWLGNGKPGLECSAIGALGTLILIIVVGIYIAADPGPYRRGLLRLLPLQQRRRVDAAMAEAGRGLSRWLVSQSIAMVTVGTMTAIGLTLLGMPLALPLGIITGLLEFVPFFGTITSSALIILLAFAQGAVPALNAALLCLFVQQFESYVLQPFLQRWAVALPPAVGLTAVLVFGALAGPLGVVLATPLMVAVMALVQRLYVDGTIEADTPPIRASAPAQDRAGGGA
ncbi:MAG: AI-2E family transporter [Burkholderiaceae bacterium]|nr:AI-2E family transporter [Burkholderiaceae bacterium]